MKKILPILILGLATLSLVADDLQKARFTEVIKDVVVTKSNNTDSRAAKVNDWFEVPEVIRTGMDSRAELEAPDKTIARVGSNTIFSFEPSKRTMNLQSGSVLFHSPKGMGGGTIKTAAATAAVTGTTIIAGATSNGGFKLMVLEGQSRVTHPSGDSKVLNPGQMTFLIPGQNILGPTVNFDLQRATQNSNLVNGFDKSISSQSKIDSEVGKQQDQIKTGKAKETGVPVGDVGPKGPKVGPEIPVFGPGPFSLFRPNDFNKLASYVDSLSSTDITFSNNDLGAENSFLSGNPVKGNYKGFNINSTGRVGALAGRDIVFALGKSYDLSKFTGTGDFGFFATGTASNSLKFTNNGGGIDFLNAPSGLHFLSANGGISFTGTNTLTFSSKTVSFEALNDIAMSGSAASTTFTGVSGMLDKITMYSKSGNISLSNPDFNARTVVLSGYIIDIDNFHINSVTGAKDWIVYTGTNGQWYVGSTSVPTHQSGGGLYIHDTNSTNFLTTGSTGTPVSNGATISNIHTLPFQGQP